MSSQKRILALDYTRAIAIILVVIGHWTAQPEPDWWITGRKAIYTFHMPLFLAISAFLFMYTRKPQSYFNFIKGKFRRLMIPYFSASVIVIGIKLLTQSSAQVDHPVDATAFLSIFYLPTAAYFFWFLWTLWTLFLIIPFFKNRGSRTVLFLITCVLAYIPWEATEIFCLRQTQRMAVWFMAGIMLYDWREYLPKCSLRTVSVLGALGIAFLILYLSGKTWAEAIVGFISIPLVPGMFRLWESHIGNRWHRILLSISSASFFIYLFHTTFLGFIKSASRPLLASGNQLIYAGVAVFAVSITVWLTTWLAERVLNRSKAMRFMFGLSKPQPIKG